MADYNILKQTVREALLADPAVTAIVSTRIYGAHLATLRDTAYPVLTFQFAEGHDYVFIVKNMTMTVSAHSNLHYDQAHNISDAAFDILKNSVLAQLIVVNSRGTPYEQYESTSRIYSVHRRYYVNWIV